MLALPFRSQSNRKPNRSRKCRPMIEQVEPRTLLSAVQWTGEGGNNNWDTPANWSTDSVPGPADDVTINIPANVVHSANVADSINSLTSTEPLMLSGGTLSIAAASTIDSTLSLTGGTLTGTGDLSVSGLVTLTTGTLSGSSALNADGGMLINPPDNGFRGTPGVTNFSLDGRVVNNAVGQTATWTGSTNSIEASDGSVFNNLGAFVDQASGFYYDTGIGSVSSFVDRGSFTQSGSSAGVQFYVPFNVPGGSVDVQNGTMDIEAGGSSTGGTFTLEGVLDIEQDAYTFDPTTRIGGDGGITFGISGTQFLPGDYSYTGATNVEGSVQVDGSIASSSLDIDGNLSGTGTVGSVTSFEGGNLSPGDGGAPGILNVQGDVDLSEGDWVFTGALNGPTAGAGYSQLDVSGPVNLGGGTGLDVSLGFTPANGEQFTIIKSTAPIVGTFDGIPEGASLTIGNTPFTISYHGGDGDDVVLTQANAVVAAPTVTGLSPSSGPPAGATLVTITGTGFTGATSVDFGTKPATGVTVVNSTTITADSPAGSGAVDVTVVTPGGSSATSPADRFTYVGTSPTVVLVQRYGFHMHPTVLVLTFSAPLDPEPADDVNNYQIVTMGGRGRDGNLVGHVTRVRAAVYNPATLTVTLYPRQRLDFHNYYRLTVDGATPNGLRGATGIPFDSQGNGDPGKNYETTLSWKNLVLTPAQARKYFHAKAKRG